MLFGRKKRSIVRILIVEDEPLVAFDTEHFLGGEGFAIAATVDTVAGATAVLAGISADEGIDLVLVDVNLSDGSGLAVARDASARDIPVLLVTGACPTDAHEYAAGCLSKPYPQRDLLNAIRAIEAVRDGGKVPRKLPSSFNLFRHAA